MRVFGLGLSRTGTTSLNSALKTLGYKAKHHPSTRWWFGRLAIGFEKGTLERFDALTDIPVVLFYKRLDRMFPGSKFILTERDMDQWLDSCERFRRLRPGYVTGRRARRVRRAVYRTTTFDQDLFRAAYQRHRADVVNYFSQRPTDLLMMNITNGDGWEMLCPFLNKPIPDHPFPHLNLRTDETKLPTSLEANPLPAGTRGSR